MESLRCFGGCLSFLHPGAPRRRRQSELNLEQSNFKRMPSELPGAFDFESAAQLPMSISKLRSMLQSFDFVTSTDEEVMNCAHCIFEQMIYEASKLTGSALTAAMAETCVLQHQSLSKMMAHFLACKVNWSTLPLKAGSLEESIRTDLRAQEWALYDEMKVVLAKPAVLRALVSDLTKAFLCDPAAESFLQLALYFKGFHALTTHRVAHDLWERGGIVNQNAALMLQSRMSELFSVDIHPGATIGNGVMIDHATGVVIGATAQVGNDVMMLHQVTLGATGKPTGGAKRHPTVGSRVVLGAGSLVLGDVMVGSDTTVGARAIVSKDIARGSTVIEVNKVIKRLDVTTPLAKDMKWLMVQDTMPDMDYTQMWSI
eukprot:TRINITY_DN76872_c0_g1_i1.p1 TRINITY_DN76872_c0_g1~~TRINITY_DN76872_c0_g1_i1.p1  ORF type:complete len:372 (+),score=62.65 TRINITY_DN76872_c0_g1_i1:38-1153(+)